MPQTFPASLRLAQSVATVLGADDSLQSINTTEFSDRAIVAVKENDSLYMLHKESTATPSGTSPVRPAAGPGRWFVYSPGSPVYSSLMWCPNVGLMSSPWTNYRPISLSSYDLQSSSADAPFDAGSGGYLQIRYTGDTTRFFLADCRLFVAGDNNGFTLLANVAKDTTPTSQEIGEVSIVTGNNQLTYPLSFQRLISVNPGEVVRAYLKVPGGTYAGSLTLNACSLSLIEM